MTYTCSNDRYAPDLASGTFSSFEEFNDMCMSIFKEVPVLEERYDGLWYEGDELVLTHHAISHPHPTHRSTDHDLIQAWQKARENDECFVAGDPQHTPEQAAECEELSLITPLDTTGMVCAYDFGALQTWIIGDVNGPWACVVPGIVESRL